MESQNSTTNRFAALSDKKVGDQINTKTETPVVQEETHFRNLAKVLVRADVSANSLSFEELASAFITMFRGYTKKSAFGETVRSSTPKIQAFITQLCALYDERSCHISDDLLWTRNIHLTFAIKGQDLPCWSENKDTEQINIETVLRLLCAQIRTITNKGLISRGHKGLQGEVTSGLQEDINVICSDYLFDLQPIVVNTKTIYSEPLAEELRAALKNGSASKKEANAQKNTQLEAARERAKARQEQAQDTTFKQKAPKKKLQTPRPPKPQVPHDSKMSSETLETSETSNSSEKKTPKVENLTGKTKKPWANKPKQPEIFKIGTPDTPETTEKTEKSESTGKPETVSSGVAESKDVKTEENK